MDDGLCQCGCGQPAPLAKRTVSSRGRYKDQPMKFIRGHNSVGMNRSKPWKTERYRVEDRGYKTPCWIWLLKISAGGYGMTKESGKETTAHRWYYEQAHGPVPKGMQVDHLCRVRSCVNPDHMEAVTPLENTRRSRSMKLTLADAMEIEHLARTTSLTIAEIAERFVISRATVSLIKKNGASAPRRRRLPPT